MDSRKRTPLIMQYKNTNNNHKSRVQSYHKNYQMGNNNSYLPLINNRYMNLQRNSSIKNINITTNLNKKTQFEIKFINSFSEARLPPQLKDLSYDNPNIK